MKLSMHPLKWNETQLKNHPKLYGRVSRTIMLSLFFGHFLAVQYSENWLHSKVVNIGKYAGFHDVYKNDFGEVFNSSTSHRQIRILSYFSRETFYQDLFSPLCNFVLYYKCLQLKWPMCNASYPQKGNKPGSISTEKSVVF